MSAATMTANPLGFTALRTIDRLYYAFPHEMRRWVYAAIKPREFNQLRRMRDGAGCPEYTFREFDRSRCIFVHVPKTAGVAIAQTLFGNLAGGHTPAFLYEVVFPRRKFESYFKFAFVRNPWDRLLSAYNFLLSGGMTDADRLWAQEHLSSVSDFSDFVCNRLSSPAVFSHVHFVPQYWFLCRPSCDRLLVDFVGRFERLQGDFRSVRKELGRSDCPDLPILNRGDTESGDYRDYYTPQARDVVAELYQKDVDLFGYRF